MEKLNLGEHSTAPSRPRNRVLDQESRKEIEVHHTHTPASYSSQSRAGVQHSRNNSDESDCDAESENTCSKYSC